MKLLLASVFIALLAETPLADPDAEARAQSLMREIRCVACENEPVSQSSAAIAEDMRIRIREMVDAGASDKEVRDWFVSRYGEFVLFRPPARDPSGWLLWGLAHLPFMPANENRLSLLTKWLWMIATQQRASLLITGRPDQHIGVDVGLERAVPPGGLSQPPGVPPSGPLNRLISTPRITAM